MTVLGNALFALNQPGNIGGLYGEAKLAIFFGCIDAPGLERT